MSVLAVVPFRLELEPEAELLLRCLVSLGATAPEAEVVLVDAGSPATGLVDGVEAVAGELGHSVVRGDGAAQLADAVNVGLQAALDSGRDALIVHPDVQFLEPGWLDALAASTDASGRPAAIAGGRLLAVNGRISSAGLYLSLLRRSFDQRFRWAPGDLPEANLGAVCPVDAALQLIRHDTIAAIGLYSERCGRGEEHVDYCLRAFGAGLQSVYVPTATALVVESGFRERMRVADDFADAATFRRLEAAHPSVDLGSFVLQEA